jgi:hypothetical protein
MYHLSFNYPTNIFIQMPDSFYCGMIFISTLPSALLWAADRQCLSHPI